MSISGLYAELGIWRNRRDTHNSNVQKLEKRLVDVNRIYATFDRQSHIFRGNINNKINGAILEMLDGIIIPDKVANIELIFENKRELGTEQDPFLLDSANKIKEEISDTQKQLDESRNLLANANRMISSIKAEIEAEERRLEEERRREEARLEEQRKSKAISKISKSQKHK